MTFSLNIIQYYFSEFTNIFIKHFTCCTTYVFLIFEPLRWNSAFDYILKEQIPPRVNIICYADDTLVVTAEDDIPMLQWKMNTTLEAMTHWIKLARLSLSTIKAEAVLFTRCSRFSHPSFYLKKGQIRPYTTLKYLGLWFDGKLTFK